MEVENHLNWTEGLINAIDYIETHLIDGEVLDQNTIARQAYSSPDNFRKVFHLITPLISQFILAIHFII